MVLKVLLLLKPISEIIPSIGLSRNLATAATATIVKKPTQKSSLVVLGKPVHITRRVVKHLIKSYPTLLQYPDGSTIMIPYHEPVGVIKLPLDLNTLTEAEKKARLLKRIPRTKVKIVDDIEDDFDESRYLKFTKKK
ncbi:hypothetical protein TKK_0014110 [Trichogramma kaykai]|uniref:39S ribosomal protein L55, mitochondrial n=1 Tax=Trichogramma kaykai TaxID=54128 RepID=A0ABD2WFP4_9HYME